MSNKMAVAYHEAGHAVAAWHFGYDILSVTIVEDDDSSGSILIDHPLRYVPNGDTSPEVQQMVLEQVTCDLAGKAAQVAFDPDSWLDFHGASDDELAIERISFLGVMDEAAVYQGLVKDAQIIVEKYRSAIKAVAEALTKHDTLTGDEVKAVVKRTTGEVRERSSLYEYESAPSW